MSTSDNQSVEMEQSQSEVHIYDGSLVGELRKKVVDDITCLVRNTFNFNPAITWPNHKKAGRVDNIWKALKVFNLMIAKFTYLLRIVH